MQWLNETMQLIINLDESGTNLDGLPSATDNSPCLMEAFQELCDLGEAAKHPYMKDCED